jgi:hypothetical protein
MPPAIASALLALLGPTAQAAESFESFRYYVGDPHTHTGVSTDGGSADLGRCKGTCGNFTDVFADGRANGLDWMAVSDHTNGSVGNPLSDSDEYRTLTELSLASHDPEGGFVTLPAAEVWNRQHPATDLGHITVLLFGDNDQLAALELSDLQPSGSEKITVSSCKSVGAWLEEVEATFGPVLAIPHHPTAKMPMATNWECNFPSYQPAVEVYSEHGQSLTGDSSGFDPMWSGAVGTGAVHYAMDPDGLAIKLGFMAGSDRHDTTPGKPCQLDTVHTSHPYGGGMTIAVLDEDEQFSRTTLYEAIVDRRTYATTGPVIPVVVEYSTGGAVVAGIGADIGLPAGQDLDVEVRIPSELVEYVIGVNLVSPDGTTSMSMTGDGVWTATYADGQAPAWTYPALEIDGDSYWGEGNCDDGGPDGTEWLWLSPSWVEEAEPDLDGDGVTWADGDCDDGDSSIYLGADEVWDDGVDQDCDGRDSDQDGDGFGATEDCDDRDASVHPDAEEVWYDGIDQDCDGNDDDQDQDGWDLYTDCDDLDARVNPLVEELWYDGVDQDCDGNDTDQDGDGWDWESDCLDTDATRHPSAVETWYDGVDQDCDGNDDDQDGDGVPYGSDCDDTDASVAPGKAERWYDGVDQDCDGNDDDQDGDGWGLGDDCDDADEGVHPGATERWYDGVDQDCDGNDADQDRDGHVYGLDCDDRDASVSPSARETWYDGIDQDCDGNDTDQDGDGFHWSLDCDDTDASSHPGAVEVWYDGVDQDCDGRDDDRDQDGFGIAEDCDDDDARLTPAECAASHAVLPDDAPVALCASAAGGRANAVWMLVAGLVMVRRRRRAA